MNKVFITRCALLLLVTGCAGAGGPSQRAAGPIRAVIKLTHPERPSLGQPIKVTVGIVNEGPVSVSFDFAEADINDSFVVTGPDGRRVPYIWAMLIRTPPPCNSTPVKKRTLPWILICRSSTSSTNPDIML